MFCTNCGRELQEEDKFCSSCGKSTLPETAAGPEVPRRRLVRPMKEKKIAGVCAGFARYLNVDVTLVRIVWIVVALAAGTGFLAYLVAWIAMPKDYNGDSVAPSSNLPATN
ncbi:MAG: PspC domain-containing protein [Bryobacteraceae bacterium]